MTGSRGSRALSVLLIVLLVGVFTLFKLHTRPTAAPATATLGAVSGYTVDTAYARPSMLTLRHSVDGTSHTFEGILTMPLCDTYSSSVSNKGGSPTHISLSFEILRPTGTCRNSQASSTPFIVSITGSSNKTPIIDSTLINNIPVNTTTTEAQ